jgi:hypothetical protein
MSEIYLPPGCTPLNKAVVDPQIRLGIQGPPGTGKTWTALTFTNPAVGNFDRALGAHMHREDVIDIPFYKGEFCDKIVNRAAPVHPPNRSGALKKWLMTEALKLTADQTLVLDGLTGIDSAFGTQYNLNPVYTDSGAINKFAVWNQRMDYFSEVFDSLTDLKCNVVFICHETVDRNDKGELNGKVRPLIQGQFGDKIVGRLTDCFRQDVFEKPDSKEKREKAKAFFGITDTTLDRWIAKTPPEHKCMYLWQTQGGALFNAKASSLVNPPKYIYACWEEFQMYRRKAPISVQS